MAALDRMSLYPFQKEGIAFATNREASLIADDMGLGKTARWYASIVQSRFPGTQSRSPIPAELSQCEDRLHRIGTQDSVSVQHLVLAGSLDAMMVKVLLKKQRTLNAVLSEHAVS
jgi:SNF2 family DNA or RNA helicase